MSSERPALRYFALAAGAGLAHALPSLYWAFGGTWLLDTVGQFAVRLAAEEPTHVVLLMLLPVAAVKVAGAIVPYVDHRRLPPHRWVRVVSWCGAAVLILWGAAGTIGGWIALAGGADPAGAHGRAALGHAVLWDPLFVAWGVLLALGLHRSRSWRRAAAPVPPRVR